MSRRRAPNSCFAAVAGLCLAAAAVSAQVQPAPAAAGLTLASAIERAIAVNPAIAAARLQRPIDAAGIAVAGERPNPEVTYEYSKETPRQAIGGTLPIELGGKRQRRLDLANATVAVTEADLARLIAEVRNDVRRAYYEVVAADARVRIADDVRGLAQRARDAASARVTSGDVPRSDLTQADLALANSASDLVAARGEAAATRAELNALIGQPVDAPVVPADALAGGALPTPEQAVALATASNGELQVLDRRIAEQTARVNLAKSLRQPDLSAGGAFTYDAEPEFSYGWRVNFGITVPVFTTHKAAVLVEDATLVRLNADRAAIVARMTGGIGAALARASAARDQLTTYQSTILPLALEAERQAQAAYDGGQIGLPALVQALQTARETRQRGLQAGLDFQHALADLERAMGTSIR
jgi:outer membrane protein, heavy metal efflux system